MCMVVRLILGEFSGGILEISRKNMHVKAVVSHTQCTHTCLVNTKQKSVNIAKRVSIEFSGASRDGKLDFKLMRKET